ncbi:hypothetical protein ACWGH3_14825 [Streptomyces sp. NPDC054884]|uniref:hypothetical protein n=1 Tax=Streptomyces sp. ME08-AFT2 TaxID=3028683 RepID=UPI0029BB81E3|nr:hypothetical protein [Streptomyces sp. ME08-AFT2]MDX3311089.1 hypothetical protein [Streptomyces sp. ME08-AFT2]
MGALRRIRLVPVTAVAVAAIGVVGCEPGGLSTMSVAHTTDVAATAEIQRRDVDVRWLTCTAHYGDEKKAGAVAAVDCRGKTADGRDITVKGQVARAVDGACVRGDLTAAVGRKQLFRVSGLGDCGSATPSPVKPSGSAAPGARPTVTVTVTVTETVRTGGGSGGSGTGK